MTDDQTQWAGQGWRIQRQPADPAPITVDIERGLTGDQARQLATALGHAAYNSDGEPTEHDWTHAILMAVLIKHGGSVHLTPEDLQADAMGGGDGRFHGYVRDLGPDGLRVAIQASDQQQSG